MLKNTSHALRDAIEHSAYADEAQKIADLKASADLSVTDRDMISTEAAILVRAIRNDTRPGLMEVFLAEYGLSTDEGIALMCLAEALLRVPDADTIDALIEDKIAPSDWASHLGHSTSPLVNASTWALMLTGRVLHDEDKGPVSHLRSAIRRLGEPVIRTAVSRAMREMGNQFVLGETIASAMKRASRSEAKGYTYSYDMLGEAARTDEDAQRYFEAYRNAIRAIASAAKHDDIRENPGISVKLSALHPRYDILQRDLVEQELIPRFRALCIEAAQAGIGLNVDAEEADRLTISLDVIEAVLADPALAGWDGFGVVVQAYGKRAADVVDWLYDLATRLDRKIMVRLVKGAYWDTEIKRAQVAGLDSFPVFTSKAATDVSYISIARKLLGMTDRIYPQFATHNAHTVAAVLHMADDLKAFEFQRLHGMGEALHDIVKSRNGTRCRIYAPVGAHRDLLAYLVRRLLENGANSSFVNQIVDEDVSPTEIAADPFDNISGAAIQTGPDLFMPERTNSKGWDMRDTPDMTAIDTARGAFANHAWTADPVVVGQTPDGTVHPVLNPAKPDDHVGQVTWAGPETVAQAVEAASPWNAPAVVRAAALTHAAHLYEENFGELFALLHREAGKSVMDAIAELREAVDFLRYYAARATDAPALGRFACISPWNFPLAIFTGQIAAALAAGNAVLAKPAEQTPLIAVRAAELMIEAGVPPTALQILPGDGATGAALTSNPAIDGVAFTGSTETAQIIHKTMAKHLNPGAPLIAETGGLNAMVVDSTALPEQAVQAIIESAFQSAGQRCSALRCLYVQEDIADGFIDMLKGAMDCLQIGDPWQTRCDVGPVIDEEARAGIQDYIDEATSKGRVLHALPCPDTGHFVAPTLIKVNSIADLGKEVFGPVLHVATFKSDELDAVIDAINGTGYGLTFGLQTRIDDRVQYVADRIEAGNIYVNRNQIGAIVGSQPFGGEGLSGTGPKAGGPLYLDRFRAHPVDQPEPKAAPDAQLELPGPTGESNVLTLRPRKPILCLGPTSDDITRQVQMIETMGGAAKTVSGQLEPAKLAGFSNIAGAIWWGDHDTARGYRKALAQRAGPILPLITGAPDTGHVMGERHVCVDTTAAGGNAKLLSGAS